MFPATGVERRGEEPTALPAAGRVMTQALTDPPCPWPQLVAIGGGVAKSVRAPP
jgi:hypothetical protein